MGSVFGEGARAHSYEEHMVVEPMEHKEVFFTSGENRITRRVTRSNAIFGLGKGKEKSWRLSHYDSNKLMERLLVSISYSVRKNSDKEYQTTVLRK